MSEDKPGKHRWTDPVVLVPIITAVIASIVGPTYLLMLQSQERTSQSNEPTPSPSPEPSPSPSPEPSPSPSPEPTPSPSPEPTPSPSPEPSTQSSSLTLMTDKKSYGSGDIIEVSGSVKPVAEGKTIRLDVYKPGRVILNDDDGKDQTNIRIYPDRTGLFSHTFQLPVVFLESGVYTISATYMGNTTEFNFSVR